MAGTFKGSLREPLRKNESLPQRPDGLQSAHSPFGAARQPCPSLGGGQGLPSAPPCASKNDRPAGPSGKTLRQTHRWRRATATSPTMRPGSYTEVNNCSEHIQESRRKPTGRLGVWHTCAHRIERPQKAQQGTASRARPRRRYVASAPHKNTTGTAEDP